MKMVFARGMTKLIFLAAYVAVVHGAQCTTEEGCREHLSCQTGGTVYCCPGGEKLVVNGTSGDCNCNGTGSSGFSCSGGASLGQGSQFLPSKPGPSSSSVTSASALTCAMASFAVLAGIMAYK